MAAPFRFIITDFKKPRAGTPAAVVLKRNVQEVHRLGCCGPEPVIENINGFDMPDNLKDSARVIIAGSPHCHDAEGNSYEGTGKSSAGFKTNLFYSLWWHTRNDQVIIITYAPKCCDKLVLWAEKKTGASYATSQGLLSNIQAFKWLRARSTTFEQLRD